MHSSYHPATRPSSPGMIFLLECLDPSTTLYRHFRKYQLSVALTSLDGHSVGLVTLCDGRKEIMEI